MRVVNMIHQPIAWQDFLENSGHHTLRFLTEGRHDTIPVYLGDGEKNTYACLLISLGTFRAVCHEADKRLLEFWLRSHAGSTEVSSAMLYEEKQSIPAELAEGILARRKDLSAGEVSYAYLYAYGQGYQGVIAIHSAKTDMSFLTKNTQSMLILAPPEDDWYRQVLGQDTRSLADVKSRYGEIPLSL